MSSGSETVEQAVLATLQVWLPVTLDDVWRQALDSTTPPYPNSWQNFDTLETWSEVHMPAILVSVPRVTSTELHSDSYSATFAIEVVALCWASDYPTVRLISRRYATAIELAVAQHGSLGIDANSMRWMTTEMMDLPDRNKRAAGVSFSVVLDGVLQRYSKIIDPPQIGTPPDPLPTIQDVEVDVIPEGAA
jgi:hypothetical protein